MLLILNENKINRKKRDNCCTIHNLYIHIYSGCCSQMAACERKRDPIGIFSRFFLYRKHILKNINHFMVEILNIYRSAIQQSFSMKVLLVRHTPHGSVTLSIMKSVIMWPRPVWFVYFVLHNIERPKWILDND